MDKWIVLDDVLIPSLMRLYDTDYDNILFGVSERNICARLAHHMENIMREYDKLHGSGLFNNYYADVEYNRMGNGSLKRYENSKHMPQYMVSDLLIQSRGVERNYLAVEMKRKGNNRNSKEDRERLISLVSSQTTYSESECVFNTLVGAFIVYSPKNVQIELFWDRLGQGKHMYDMNFVYRKDIDGRGVLLRE